MKRKILALALALALCLGLLPLTALAVEESPASGTNSESGDGVAVVLYSTWAMVGEVTPDGGIKIDPDDHLEAELLFMDGSTEVVRVSKFGVPNGPSGVILKKPVAVFYPETAVEHPETEVKVNAQISGGGVTV